jgi:hypothetical protein
MMLLAEEAAQEDGALLQGVLTHLLDTTDAALSIHAICGAGAAHG